MSEQDPALIEDFKQGMRRLTSTVALITTEQGGVPFGMAVTAVCSVGISPPSLLISVSHTASMHEPVLKRGAFCVNLLTEEHSELVGAFSGKLKGADRFNLGAWSYEHEGLPALAGAQATFFCNSSQTVEHAGHTIIIGEVTKIDIRDDIHPLLYENGQLARAQVLQ